jgi:hypothetical protein
MYVQIADVQSRCGTLLNDAGHRHWTNLEIAAWAADAQKEIAQVKPTAVAVTASINLDQGAKQTLPADGVCLLDVLGNTDGAGVRVVSRELLNSQVPNWQMGKQSKVIRHVMFDQAMQTVFYVYPPAAPGSSLDIVYASLPTNGSLTLDQVWLPTVINYVMYRAYAKDAEFAGNAALATAYYQAFIATLNGKSQAESASNINLANLPPTPAVPQSISR